MTEPTNTPMKTMRVKVVFDIEYLREANSKIYTNAIRNSSPGRYQERRVTQSLTMSVERINEELERFSLLQNACSGGGEESCSEQFSFLRSVSETDLSPLHGGTDSPLGRIVGRFNSFVL